MSKDKEICYYCGGPATSKEHIPPRAFFPTDFREQLFTVPSCDEHNGDKSKDDEYVKVVLTRSADLMLREDLRLVKEKSEKAVSRSPAFRAKVELNPEPAEITLPNGDVVPTFSHEIDLDRIFEFFGSLARGLYFHHEGEVWNGKISVAPHFLIRDDAEKEDIEKNEELLEFFDRDDSHGANKNIFYYNFVYILDDDRVWTGACILAICLFDKFKISLIMRPYKN
ncbi:hypothetical protein ND926_20880 [Vibrio diabolicus]|uniref:hypothetical protein n=1 Tax=Vibrio harveyi group TaxID=717610 RepID=UPI001869D258|nr:hypothetical protein [Vibrio diabolicus]MBE4150867.1 hypothetical protein [Vibrio parahaemolyticus]MCR9565415.1 hypothetical protein [Vibrio alginolyticus]MCS0339908.1 hypothetical protein [Vibrio diabolicus]